MLRLDLLEFIQQFVEFQITDDWRIQYVITMVVGVDLLFQFFVAGFCVHVQNYIPENAPFLQSVLFCYLTVTSY